MDRFIQKYEPEILGVLNGFDRLLIRGTIRSLMYTAGMMGFLNHISVLAKDFAEYAQMATKQLKDACCSAAEALDRPIVNISFANTDKETKARQIAEKDNITEGLICIFKSLDPCMSFEIHKNRSTGDRELKLRRRMCQHLYHYWIDPVFGFMHVRVQTWFPFTIQLCINGREWLACQMDRKGLGYQRVGNCFPMLDDIEGTQRLMDRFLKLPLASIFKRISRKVNPIHQDLFKGTRNEYFWSIQQSEWATDIMFRSSDTLDAITPALTRGAISSFMSEDVMHFLGKKLNGNFQGEVTGSYKKRPEGVRIKHQVKTNWVKAYTKQGTILRAETVINDPKEFKVFRRTEGKPDEQPSWQGLRKGIVDIRARAKVSQKVNEAYLDALGQLDTDETLQDLIEPVTRRVRWKKQTVRGLKPWTLEDRSLFMGIHRGEFTINGFKNSDIVQNLYPMKLTKEQTRKVSAAITRKFRMLRAHRLIRKMPHSHRYKVTSEGRKIITAILQAQDVTLHQLNQVAA